MLNMSKQLTAPEFYLAQHYQLYYRLVSYLGQSTSRNRVIMTRLPLEVRCQCIALVGGMVVHRSVGSRFDFLQPIIGWDERNN